MDKEEKRSIVNYFVEKGKKDWRGTVLNTVFGEIRALDSIPTFFIELAEIDIDDERRRIINKWRSQEPLLEKILLKGESIKDLASYLVEQYQTWKLYIPFHNKRDEFYQSYNTSGLNKILSPVEGIKHFSLKESFKGIIRGAEYLDKILGNIKNIK